MRFVTWNCRIGGFRRKVASVATLRPDILAVQECEPLDAELFLDGDQQPTYRDRLSQAECPARGVALLSYSELRIARASNAEGFPAFRMFETSHNGVAFNVVAAWTWEAKPRSSSYRQVHEGLVTHETWVRSRPTVILGDLNSNGAFKGRTWTDLIQLTDRYGLVSAYHAHFGEVFGKETRPTHFFRGKENAPFHLDYCFLPATWAGAIADVQVGTFNDWHHLSDHAPLIVDFDMEKVPDRRIACAGADRELRPST